MGNIYKLTINNTGYWNYYVSEGKTKLKRTNEPCHLYLEKTRPFVDDKMICNFRDASGKKYLHFTRPLGTRLRKHKDFIIIEPSGIMVPNSNFKLVEDQSTINADESINISTITRDTFYCDFISDFTRGGKDTLSQDEVATFRSDLLDQSVKLNGPGLTPFEFSYMYIHSCYKKGIKSFDCNSLLEFIINSGNKPEYLPLLWNIDYSIGEHYDESDGLLKSFGLLRYIGLVYPDYESENSYNNLKIDRSIKKYPPLISGKESYIPLMDQFVEEQFELKKNDNRKVKQILIQIKEQFNKK